MRMSRRPAGMPLPREAHRSWASRARMQKRGLLQAASCCVLPSLFPAPEGLPLGLAHQASVIVSSPAQAY
eukprot:1161311-Pelagomonas_calceolata.AAC.10